jgi:hypothetical protein
MLKARTALGLSTIVAFLLLFEVGLRFASPIPPRDLLPFPYDRDRIQRIVDDDSYLRFDRDLGWAPTPYFVRRSGGQVFRTNGLGMRAERDYPLTVPPGIARIAAFGDSFTYCSEATQAACWVPRLESSWPGSEVLNYGVPGYGPDQAWLRYQRDGRQFRPCGVLIGYFVEDIDRVVNRFRPFISPDDSVMMSKPRYLLDGAGLALLPNAATSASQVRDPAWVEETLGPHDAWFFPGTFAPSPFDRSSIVRHARTAAYQHARASLVRTDGRYPLYDEHQEAYQVTGRILIEFARQVQDDGATPVVVVLPGERDLREYRDGVHAYDRLLSWLSEAGVATIDLTDVLAQGQAHRDISGLFADGRHYSADGNAVVAGHLAKTLPPLVAGTCRG